jgi:hypothetical protein
MKFEVDSMGILYCSVCSTLSPEETTAKLNEEHPTGISSGWKLAGESFVSGEPNPCPCERHPETHKHYLFIC